MTNPRLSLAQAIAAALTPTEAALAADVWYAYLQLVRAPDSMSPELVEIEERRRDLAASRIDGVWRAFLATRGYNQTEWDVRVVNVPPGTNTMTLGGGGFSLPPGANKYGVNLSPRTRPPM